MPSGGQERGAEAGGDPDRGVPAQHVGVAVDRGRDRARRRARGRRARARAACSARRPRPRDASSRAPASAVEAAARSGPPSTAAKASFSSGAVTACSAHAEARELARRRLDVEVARDPGADAQHRRAAQARTRRLPPRTVRASSVHRRPASAGAAVTVANGGRSRTSAFASITAATCDEFTVACAWVSPSGSRSIVGPFQTTSGTSRPASARGRVARRGGHRRCEDDGVGRASRSGAFARSPSASDASMPASTTSNSRREHLGEAASDRLALLPEARRHLLVEEREVAGDDADAAAAQSRCQSSS